MSDQRWSVLLSYLRRLAPGVGRAPDQELLERFATHGDEGAFEALLARHGPMVLRVGQRLLHDRHQAEDVFQATFLTLACKAASIRRRTSVGSWLHGVAYHLALRARTAAARRKTHERQAPQQAATDPLAEVSLAEALAVLDEELARLPERLRAPLVLCFLEDRTRDEAARHLGWSLATFNRRLKRGRERLQVCLTRRGLTLSAALLAALGAAGGSSAAVPLALTRLTVQAALLMAQGKTVSGAVSAEALALFQEMMAMMLMSKLKMGAALVLCVGLMTAGTGGLAYFGLPARMAEKPHEDQPALVAKEEQKLPAPAEQPPPTPLPKVSVSRPITREITDYQDYTGRTEAAEVVQIQSRVGGQLDKVFFQAGATVKQGDPLFQIDPRPLQAELEKARAEADLAETGLKRRNSDLQRANGLLQTKGNISREDFDRVAADQAEAQAAVQVARAGRDLAKLNLSYAWITAPISGKIGRPLMTAGNFVRSGDTLLATIVSTAPMYVYFDVDERTLLHLQKMTREGKLKEVGAAVQLGLADDKGFPYRGKIDFADNRIDPAKGTLRLRAVFPNSDGVLLPGLFVRVHLATSEPYKAQLVVEQAVWRYEDKPYVYIVNEKNVAERRPVNLGSLHDGLRVVKEGLRAGDRVIVSGLADVKPGMTVKPELVDMPIQPPASRTKPGE